MFGDMTTTAPVTADELFYLKYPDKQVELIRGQLVVREPPGTWHGKVSGGLTGMLDAYVRRHKLGVVLGQDTGFKIESDPDTVRAPDVAFLAAERVQDIPRRGYAALAPDLAVEILSPSDSPDAVLGKVADWLRAGTRLVWVIDPERQEARVYRPDGSVTTVGAGGVLKGEDVIPGLLLPLEDVLA